MLCEELSKQAISTLEAAGNDNAAREVAWLLEQQVAKLGCLELPEELPPELEGCFLANVRRRADGEPLQYVMGTAEFFNAELEVGPGVLIPRPETEQLVELALSQTQPNSSILDLCTGSGAIALAMAKELPGCQITGVDISPQALAYARRNLRSLRLGNVSLLEGDLYAPLPSDRRFDVIVSNPPYVSPSDYARLEAVVKDHEPRLALLAEDGGLAIIRRIAEELTRRLMPGGKFLCEIGEEQGPGVADILRNAGLAKVSIKKDYAGKDRFACAEKE